MTQTLEQAPLADLSIEVGHFYSDTISQGRDVLAEHFADIRILADAAIQMWRIDRANALEVATKEIEAPRVSISFLFDDYHNKPAGKIPPAEPLDVVLGAADDADMPIDYIAREAAYVPMAQAAISALTGNNGLKSMAGKSTWLASERPDRNANMAMKVFKYVPEDGADHELNIDVELLNYPSTSNGRELLACPLLASMWQIHRLGAMTGLPKPKQVSMPDELPDWEYWGEVPELIQRNPDAHPFAAQKIVSILPTGFVPVEGAVQRIATALGEQTGELQDYNKRVEYTFLKLN